MGIIQDIKRRIKTLEEGSIHGAAGDNGRLTLDIRHGVVVGSVADQDVSGVLYATVYGLYNEDGSAWVFPSSPTTNTTIHTGFPRFCTAIPLGSTVTDESKMLKIVLAGLDDSAADPNDRAGGFWKALLPGKGASPITSGTTIAYLADTTGNWSWFDTTSADGFAFPTPDNWQHYYAPGAMAYYSGAGQFDAAGNPATETTNVVYANFYEAGAAQNTSLYLAVPPTVLSLVNGTFPYIPSNGNVTDPKGHRVDGFILPFQCDSSGSIISQLQQVWQVLTGPIVVSLVQNGGSDGTNIATASYTYNLYVNYPTLVATAQAPALVRQMKGATVVGTLGLASVNYNTNPPTYTLLTTNEAPNFHTQLVLTDLIGGTATILTNSV